jgi:hypothetical protein
MRALVLFCGVFLTACAPHHDDQDAGDAAQPKCPTGILGDTSQPVAIELRALDANENDVAIADGNDLAMILPPQGGRVAFIGVRATNLDGCAVQLTGAVRDLATQQVRFDSRTVNLNATGDGWGVTSSQGQSVSSAISDYANVPMCPNEWASTDLYDKTFGLEVTVKDRAGRTATKSIHVEPRCSVPDERAECLCICKAGYTLGEPCHLDAGGDG